MKVLLVDDNRHDLYAMKRTLGDKYHTVSVANLTDAVAAVKQDTFVAIVLDLPEGTGQELIDEMKAHAIDIPIVPFTGIAPEKLGKLSLPAVSKHDRPFASGLPDAIEAARTQECKWASLVDSINEVVENCKRVRVAPAP